MYPTLFEYSKLGYQIIYHENENGFVVIDLNNGALSYISVFSLIVDSNSISFDIDISQGRKRSMPRRISPAVTIPYQEVSLEIPLYYLITVLMI